MKRIILAPYPRVRPWGPRPLTQVRAAARPAHGRPSGARSACRWGLPAGRTLRIGPSTRDPARYGGKIQVDTGCVEAFEDTIRYGVERVGGLSVQGAMTAMFGGEGLNLATLEGDGPVILQSLTYDGMATALARREGHDDRTGITGGLFGGGND